jgi:EDD domain protein, DegV family
MGKVAIITDSNSGITQEDGKKAGIYILPMPFFVNEEMYYEDVTLTQEEFYQRLKEDADISTSQPAPADVMDLWDNLLKEYDEIVHIPMSCGLSGSCETAMTLSADYEGKVFVVDNKRISVTQRQGALDAKQLAETGKSAKEIKEILEDNALESAIYLGVDTLKYLKKGGRITPAAAAIGTVLNLKPILQIQGERLDAFAKVRGWKAAKKTILEAMEKDLQTRFKDTAVHLMITHSNVDDMQTTLEWENEVKERFPGYEVYTAPVALSIACHTGPGMLAIACAKKLEI